MFEYLVGLILKLFYPEAYRPRGVVIRFEPKYGVLEVWGPIPNSGYTREILDCGKGNKMFQLISGTLVGISGLPGHFRLVSLAQAGDVEVKQVSYHTDDDRVIEMTAGDYLLIEGELIFLENTERDFAAYRNVVLTPDYEEIANAYDL